MQNTEYVNDLIKDTDPKFSHSIEKIYQWCVYDVYDQIEANVQKEATNKKIDIQIELFPVFVRTFLADIYMQMQTSKPFYFHNLSHQEQRKRIEVVLAPLLSRMVHPVKYDVVPPAPVPSVSSILSSKSKSGGDKITSSKARVVDATEEAERAALESDEFGDADLSEGEEPTSSAAVGTSGAVKSVKVVSSKLPPPSATPLKPPPSAVVLPEPIRSSKVTEETPAVDKAPLKNLIVSISAKPKTPEKIKSSKVGASEAVKPSEIEKRNEIKSMKATTAQPEPAKVERILTAKKQIVTPMKLQSEAIQQKAAKVQSSARILSSRPSALNQVRSAKVSSQ